MTQNFENRLLDLQEVRSVVEPTQQELIQGERQLIELKKQLQLARRDRRNPDYQEIVDDLELSIKELDDWLSHVSAHDRARAAINHLNTHSNRTTK